jgi:hypothetical protein
MVDLYSEREMTTLLEPLVKRNDVQVKVDATVATHAKMVAAAKGITVAEYVSELLRPLVLRDLEIETTRQLKRPNPQKK